MAASTLGSSLIKLLFEANDAQAVAPYSTHFELCQRPAATWPDQTSVGSHDWWLQYRDQRLRLCRGLDDRGVCVDPKMISRRAVRGSELARACGLAQGRGAAGAVKILDGTCGWGIDGLSLARLGARVTLVEESPVVWALAHDLLRTQPGLDEELLQVEMRSWLAQREPGMFDVIYLDPMFPPRRKSAAPNKRIQYLAALLEAPAVQGPAFEAWLALCRAHATQRVVLKRRRTDPPLGQAASWQIKGRSIRYDIFAPLAADPR